MRRAHWVFAAAAFCILPVLAEMRAGDEKQDDGGWTSDFFVEKGELTHTGRNPWFILEPGYVLVLEDGREQLAITVLDEMKTVDGVETRVVEERETKDGKPVEVSRNFYAISKRTNTVFYFGEEVDIYTRLLPSSMAFFPDRNC